MAEASGANVAQFPTGFRTRFQPGNQVARGRPRPPIGKRRARKLKAAIAMAEAVHGPAPQFEGDSRDFLRATMRGEIKPDAVQLNAGMALLKIEYPALAATHATINDGANLAPEELKREVQRLLAHMPDLAAGPVLDGVALPAACDGAGSLSEEERENERLRARIAEIEAELATDTETVGFQE